MPAAFLHLNRVASAVSVTDAGGGAVVSLPLSNVLDAQPRMRARWASPASCAVLVDFGTARDISAVALISTSLANATATVRGRLGNVSDLASTTWDTGAIAPQTGPDAGGNVVLLHPTSASGRYLRLDVADPDAAALDIGRIVAGPLWRLAHAPAFGIAEGRQILDQRERNGFTGAEFPVPAVVNPRSTSFTLPLITRAEATAEFRGMLAALGAAGDALWIPDDSLSLAELNLRAIWGAIAQPGESALLARPYFNGHTRNFQITERI